MVNIMDFKIDPEIEKKIDESLLFNTLKRNGLVNDETKNRIDAFLSALDGKFEKLNKFKNSTKKGGADNIPIPIKNDPNDYLGPRLRWFVEVIGSPYAQSVVRVLFMVLFFVSYLESTPAFGSILGASLDVLVAGGKALTKTIQTNLPPLVGLIPLPFMGLVGMAMAAAFGFVVWPIIAIVSFSRQDFAAAIESFIRIIIPPWGNTLADLFMEGNRMVAKIDMRRQKLAEDISTVLKSLSDKGSMVSSQVKEGANKLAEKVQEVGQNVPVPLPNIPSRAATGGRRKRFSSKPKNINKWKTRRNKFVKH